MNWYLYRIAENDDDGDPYDWGVVQAATVAQAQDKIEKHIHGILDNDEPLTCRLYPVTGWDANGIAETNGEIVEFEIEACG